ncbi:MAG: TetR/AcrR family transcriptional regulator [Kordiimonadaceae bacterium]|jgi:TetR/AcrR family transcriptional regulator, cholesterol catabolism regulator|nr:TetR/AcrR family transcriptional regulator [Kordiimonadaceae bacterium]MBT6032531.1 TetR/AcrR family transcriptional regulator [Kordiimonadaceae bacterium]
MAHSAVERRNNNRSTILLDEAAKQFAVKGYRGTTVRSIAQNIDMLPGSIYYHFKSKEALLMAVYDVGVKKITQTVNDAINEASDPWGRLEAAVSAHLEGVLDESNYARIIINIIPAEVAGLEKTLTELRNGYEVIFVKLIDDLPLGKSVDRTMFRLMLLGAINWAKVWYRPNSESPANIARIFIKFMKDPIDT